MGYYIEKIFAFEYNEHTKKFIEENRETINTYLDESFRIFDGESEKIFFTDNIKNEDGTWTKEEKVIVFLQFNCKSTTLRTFREEIEEPIIEILDETSPIINGESKYLWHSIEMGENFDDVEELGNLFDVFSIKREIEIWR